MIQVAICRLSAMLQVIFALLLLSAADLLASPSRNDRVWPISGSASVDLPQSSPFGPRIKISANSRYDFHRGVDIPADRGTPIHAIDNGIVVIAGKHDKYYDPLIQIKHMDWGERPGCQEWDPRSSYTSCRHGYFYSNYLHVDDWTVSPEQDVIKGQVIGHTGLDGRSSFPHLHFEVRAGRSIQKYCCNPWKYLPNPLNDYSTFHADITVTPNYHNRAGVVAVNISVPPDQLTFNRIELHDGETTIRKFDFCEDNFFNSLSELDNSLFNNNLLITPQRFNSRSFERNEKASVLFEFQSLPPGGGSVHAKVYDVFGNVISTSSTMYY